MFKDNTRKRLVLIRDTLGKQQRLQASELIMQKILMLPEYQQAKTVLVYYSFGSEVDTRQLIQRALLDKKIILLPRIIPAKKTIQALEIRNFNHDIQTGRLKIKEPLETCREYSKEKIDLIFIPGIAFGEKGERLGYGVGYYDRFLKGCRGKFIGLAFEQQITDKIILEPHDIKMHKIITDKRVIHCQTDVVISTEANKNK